jgi:hypothetical protein
MAKITKAAAKRRCLEAARKLEMAMMQKDLTSARRKQLFDLMNKCLDAQRFFN